MNLPVIIVGGGGHAKVLLESLILRGQKVLGIVDVDPALWGSSLRDVRFLGGEEQLQSYDAGSVMLVNGVGCVDARSLQKRKAIHERFAGRGYRFARVVHPAAILATDAILDDGVQVMAGAILQSSARIGPDTLINTGAIIEHDCRLGAHVHVATRAVLAGGVAVGDDTLIGAGAVVVQGIRIGARSVIASGAMVRHDVPAGITVAGVPAVELRA